MEPDAAKPTKDADRNLWISPAGVELISVTMALKEVGLMSYRGHTTKYMDRGTEVHNQIEALIRGDEAVAVPDDAVGYVESFVKFLEHTSPEIVASEERYWIDELGLCGQVDLIAVIGGEECIVDYKTGSPAPWHALQTAGYGILRNGEEPGARIRPRYALYLKPDGKLPKLEPHPDIGDFRLFRAALDLTWWKRKKGVKGWLMEK